jgi:hypothetical protein
VTGPGNLTFKVPAAATAGPLRITSNGATATAAFTVGYPVPTIATFSPAVGHVGQVLTIAGDGFYGALIVRFGVVTATIQSVTRTQIRVLVPAGVPDNTTISVRTLGGLAISTQHFQTDS